MALTKEFVIKYHEDIYPSQLMGVFDGHGGAEVANYLATNLEPILCKQLIQEAERSAGFTDAAIWTALKQTFVCIDQKIKVEAPHLEGQGSTATVALIFNGKLWIANVGDSRAILDRNGGTQLTEDAKPDDLRYKKSIEKRGGVVSLAAEGGVARIDWNLAVARAIGDHRLRGHVSARPKITTFPVPTAGSHLILACDGIFDVASTTQVAMAVEANSALKAEEIASGIVSSAFRAGSRDNLTALVIKF
jgi:serine/threonine protein phosphatase PrpC